MISLKTLKLWSQFAPVILKFKVMTLGHYLNSFLNVYIVFSFFCNTFREDKHGSFLLQEMRFDVKAAPLLSNKCPPNGFFWGHGSLNYPSKLMRFLNFCVLKDSVVICALKRTCSMYFGLMKSDAFHEMAFLIWKECVSFNFYVYFV